LIIKIATRLISNEEIIEETMYPRKLFMSKTENIKKGL
jgi:hypothetical protein